MPNAASTMVNELLPPGVTSRRPDAPKRRARSRSFVSLIMCTGGECRGGIRHDRHFVASSEAEQFWRLVLGGPVISQIAFDNGGVRVNHAGARRTKHPRKSHFAYKKAPDDAGALSFVGDCKDQ